MISSISQVQNVRKHQILMINPIGTGDFFTRLRTGGRLKIAPPPCKMLFYAKNSTFFMLNRNSTWFQLSLEVYYVSVAQNPNFLLFCQFLTLKNSEFQFLSYSNVIYLKRKIISCRIQIHNEKAQFVMQKIEKTWKNTFFG